MVGYYGMPEITTLSIFFKRYIKTLLKIVVFLYLTIRLKYDIIICYNAHLKLREIKVKKPFI